MSLPTSDIPALIMIEDAQIYNAVAASMFIFWDHCITFGQEVNLIWSSKLSLVNVLFFIFRYLTFAFRIVDLLLYTDVNGLVPPSSSRCIAWVWLEATVGQILFASLGTLFLIRVFAFYGKSKLLLAVLAILFLCESAAEITILAISVPEMLIVPNRLPWNLHIPACLILNTPALYPKLWIPSLVVQSILFMLVAIKTIQTAIRESIHHQHLLVVFIRDGAWGFALIFAGLLWAALSTSHDLQKGEMALNWSYSLAGFCGSRLILNLRSAAEESTTTMGVTSDLRFRTTQAGMSEGGLPRS